MTNSPDVCPLCATSIKLIWNQESSSASEVVFKNVQPRYLNYGCHIFDNQYLLGCPFCGFTFVYPYLGSKSLANFYENNYYKLRIPWKKRNVSIDSIFRIFLLKQYLGNNKDPVILDFGGSFGEMASNFKRLLRFTRTFVDDSDIYNPYWRRLDIRHRRLESFEDGEIDLFFSSHCFEHIPANMLTELMKSVHAKLSLGGLCYIEVPSEDLMSVFELGSINYVPGPHQSHFTLAALRELVSPKFDILLLETRGLPDRYQVQKAQQFSDIIPIRRGFLFRLLHRLILEASSLILSLAAVLVRLARGLRFYPEIHLVSLKDDGFSSSRPDGDYLILIARKKS